MTETEKQTLSQRIAYLAEMMGIPQKLIWDPASHCPQGHQNTDWEGGFGDEIGDVCRECETEWYNTSGEEEEITLEQRNDAAFHPEWRIGRQAKDLTTFANLLPVLEAWREQDPQNRMWMMHSAYWFYEASRAAFACVNEIEVEGDTPVIALASAFLEELEWVWNYDRKSPSEEVAP